MNLDIMPAQKEAVGLFSIIFSETRERRLSAPFIMIPMDLFSLLYSKGLYCPNISILTAVFVRAKDKATKQNQQKKLPNLIRSFNI